jgi:serine/threonine protein kinase
LTDRLKRLIGQADSVEASSMLGASRQKITLQPGDTIDDFDLLTRLGSGAFATVFLARQKSMQRLCALKVSVTRSNEAQTLAQLDHPNIVRVYDQRVIPEKNVRLLYMQYVAGASLSEVLDQLRLLPKTEWSGAALLKAISRQLQESGSGFGVTGNAHEHPLHRRLQRASWPESVCLLGIQVASALQYAHEQGVLHRDLKPANILLDENGAPKIVDFNISFCSKLDGVTPAAYFGGSLAYMSPEQLEVCHPDHPREADDVDARSDQYSLSVLLWEMLCGQRPFNDHVSDRSWPAALALAGQLRTQQPDLRHFGQLPFRSVAAIRDVLLRALASDRESRFGTADELARELRYCTEPETMASLRPSSNWWRGFVTTMAVAGLDGHRHGGKRHRGCAQPSL